MEAKLEALFASFLGITRVWFRLTFLPWTAHRLFSRGYSPPVRSRSMLLVASIALALLFDRDAFVGEVVWKQTEVWQFWQRLEEGWKLKDILLSAIPFFLIPLAATHLLSQLTRLVFSTPHSVWPSVVLQLGQYLVAALYLSVGAFTILTDLWAIARPGSIWNSFIAGVYFLAAVGVMLLIPFFVLIPLLYRFPDGRPRWAVALFGALLALVINAQAIAAVLTAESLHRFREYLVESARANVRVQRRHAGPSIQEHVLEPVRFEIIPSDSVAITVGFLLVNATDSTMVLTGRTAILSGFGADSIKGVASVESWSGGNGPYLVLEPKRPAWVRYTARIPREKYEQADTSVVAGRRLARTLYVVHRVTAPKDSYSYESVPDSGWAQFDQLFLVSESMPVWDSLPVASTVSRGSLPERRNVQEHD
jgi:hypothetical protein